MNKISARTFDNTKQGQDNANSLATFLTSEKVDCGVPVQFEDVWVIPYLKYLPQEIERRLHKLGWTDWKLNPFVVVYKGTDWPLMVDKGKLYLLGQSVPNWKMITDKLTGTGVEDLSKVMIKGEPLGFVSFKAPDLTLQKVLKEFALKPNGRNSWFSQRDDLTLEYNAGNSKYALGQTVNGLGGADNYVPRTVSVTPSAPVRPVPPTIKPADTPTSSPDALPEDKNAPPMSSFGYLSGQVIKSLLSMNSHANRAIMLLNVKRLWQEFNKAKFGSALPICKLDISKDGGTSTRTLGVWYTRERKLAISPRLFNAPINVLLETFLHEMCHQAVTDLDKVDDRTAGGHGPNWKAWMRKVGLDPQRYSATERKQFYTDKERALHDEKESNIVPFVEIKPNMLVGLWHPKKQQASDALVLERTIYKGKPAAKVLDLEDMRVWTAPAMNIVRKKKYLLDPRVNPRIKVYLDQLRIDTSNLIQASIQDTAEYCICCDFSFNL